MQAQVEHIRELLEGIQVEMQKYESLTRVTWGHVGNLGHVAELLAASYSFMLDKDN